VFPFVEEDGVGVDVGGVVIIAAPTVALRVKKDCIFTFLYTGMVYFQVG